MIQFKDVYTLPFILDDYTNDIVYISNGSDRAFDFYALNISIEARKKILDILNKDLPVKIPQQLIYKDGNIGYIPKDSGFHTILTIRGWGHLTGINGLNLHPQIATIIQNEFAEWIISKLN